MAGEDKQERNSLKTRKNLLCFIASVHKYKLTLCSLNDVLYVQNDEVLKTYKNNIVSTVRSRPRLPHSQTQTQTDAHTHIPALQSQIMSLKNPRIK